MTPQFRDQVTAEQLREGWGLAGQHTGGPVGMTIACTGMPGGAVRALITIHANPRPLPIAAAFTPAGQIAGLAILSPGGARPVVADGSAGGGGSIRSVNGGTIAGVSTALQDLLTRHVEAGTVPGAVALLGAGNVEVACAGVASIGGGPMGAGRDHANPVHDQGDYGGRGAAPCGGGTAGARQQPLVDWLPELADLQVLRSPAADLSDTGPAAGAITLRHLLTNTAGYGMVLQASPLQEAMAANGTEAGPLPPPMGADEWLRRLTELPLAFQPGEGWRYHHCFSVLGILISRVTGRPLGEHPGRGRLSGRSG